MSVLSVSCIMPFIDKMRPASAGVEKKKGTLMEKSKGQERRPIGGFFIVGVSLALLFGVALLKARVR
jgi:hypothetical protein